MAESTASLMRHVSSVAISLRECLLKIWSTVSAIELVCGGLYPRNFSLIASNIRRISHCKFVVIRTSPLCGTELPARISVPVVKSASFCAGGWASGVSRAGINKKKTPSAEPEGVFSCFRKSFTPNERSALQMRAATSSDSFVTISWCSQYMRVYKIVKFSRSVARGKKIFPRAKERWELSVSSSVGGLML